MFKIFNCFAFDCCNCTACGQKEISIPAFDEDFVLFFPDFKNVNSLLIHLLWYVICNEFI